MSGHRVGAHDQESRAAAEKRRQDVAKVLVQQPSAELPKQRIAMGMSFRE
jgi:hypothetical protein